MSERKKNVPEQNPVHAILSYLIIFSLLILLFFLTLGIIASVRNAQLAPMLYEFITTLYTPHQNIFKISGMDGLNPYFLFYTITAVAALVLFTARFILRVNGRESRLDHISWPSIGLALASLILLLQLPGQTFFFFKNFSQFTGKTTAEKITSLYPNSYGFSQYCRHYLPGRHCCRPITGLDRTNPRHMFTYSAVQYYLYPISLLPVPHERIDCEVVFVQKDPVRSVSEDFEPRELFSPKSLIALRKTP